MQIRLNFPFLGKKLPQFRRKRIPYRKWIELVPIVSMMALLQLTNLLSKLRPSDLVWLNLGRRHNISRKIHQSWILLQFKFSWWALWRAIQKLGYAVKCGLRTVFISKRRKNSSLCFDHATCENWVFRPRIYTFEFGIL